MSPHEYQSRLKKNKEKQKDEHAMDIASEDEDQPSKAPTRHPGLSIFLDSDDDEEPVKVEMSLFILLWTLLSRWVTGRTIMHMNESKLQSKEPQMVTHEEPKETVNDELDEETMKIYQDLYAQENIDIKDDLAQMTLVRKKKYLADQRMENIADGELARILAYYTLEDDTMHDEGNMQRLRFVAENMTK
jgi:hypothetical protein